MNAKELDVKWGGRKGRDLLLNGIKVASIAEEAEKRGIYSVWTNLPGASEPDRIRGLAKAKNAALKSTCQWLDKIMENTNE